MTRPGAENVLDSHSDDGAPQLTPRSRSVLLKLALFARSSTGANFSADAGCISDKLAQADVRSALDAAIPRSDAGASLKHGVLQADSNRADAFGQDNEGLLGQIAEVLGAILDAEDRHRAAAEAAAAVQALLAAVAEHRIGNRPPRHRRQPGAAGAPRGRGDMRVTALLRAAAARVAADHAVHRHLHRAVASGSGQGATMSVVDAAVLLHALCHDLASMLSGPAGDGERHLACDAEPFPWPATCAGTLALIAAELAINAARHAGHRTMGLRPSAAPDGDALLAAEDDNPGFAPDFDVTQAARLGLRLVRTMAGSGDDRVTVEHDDYGDRIQVRIARGS